MKKPLTVEVLELDLAEILKGMGPEVPAIPRTLSSLSPTSRVTEVRENDDSVLNLSDRFSSSAGPYGSR